MKATLESKFGNKERTLTPPNFSSDDHKRKLKRIHTEPVTDMLNSMADNKVLNTQPRPIDDSEKDLPRAGRTTLALDHQRSLFKNSTFDILRELPNTLYDIF